MSKDSIRNLIKEKFGYTTDMKKVTSDGYPTSGKEPQKSAHPMEKFRNVIKAVLGATTTEQDGILENVVDFNSLFRLANKHGLAPIIINNLKELQVEIEKPKTKRDRDVILKLWTEIKDTIPYWFLGLLAVDEKEEMAEDDKQNITKLLNYMTQFNKDSEKAGKENAKETEHAGRDTQAKENLNKARKDAKIDLDAGSEKKLSKKSEIEIESSVKGESPEVPEDDSKKEGKEYKKPNKE